MTTGWNLENTYAELPGMFYRRQNPMPALAPQMVVFNYALAENLGLDAEELANSPEIFTGNVLLTGSKPIAQAYAGYQFGYFNMLGDGRAVLLGEQVTPEGDRFDIQLKGSGPTPFSRGGDGYAALLPMLREYIISEAMFALGIPTTRSLAVVLTGRDVIRERRLPGAVLTRVAASHIRVGTFNYVSAFGTAEDVHTLADYSISRHFPELENCEDKYRLFFREVAMRQAALIAQWQLVGFVHGVMNTDNTAISGETIDYGPCAFMDTYDPHTVFSSIDTHGRYSYNNQPKIGAWNLARLAESLLTQEQAEDEIAYYWECYSKNWLTGMRAKLGLSHEEPGDATLIAELLDLMRLYKLDYTNTFRGLLLPIVDTSPLFTWHKKWRARVARQVENPAEIMKNHNPTVIPRNHRVEEALTAVEGGDFSVMLNLLAVLGKPFEDNEIYAQPPTATACGYQTFCGT